MPSNIRRRKRKDGTTAYLVRIPLDDGEVIRATFGRLTDAKAFLGKTLDERDTGDAVRPSEQTLNAHLDEWLETLRGSDSIRENTLESYQSILANYVRPKLGRIRLKRLTTFKIQRGLNELKERGLSSRTRRYAHWVLRSALESAVGSKIRKNPMEGVIKPTAKKSVQPRPLTVDQAQALLASVAAADEALDRRRLKPKVQKAQDQNPNSVRLAAPTSAVFHVLLSAGLRPSEAFALRWDDVDLDPNEYGQGLIKVKKSLSYSKSGEWVLNEPKSEAAIRDVSIPAPTLQSLRQHRRRQKEHGLKSGTHWTDNGFVFTNAFGAPIERHNFNYKVFKPALRKLADKLHPLDPDASAEDRAAAEKARAEIMSTRLYDLRHTCATLMIKSGANPKGVSERLGHASAAFTLDTYVWPDEESKREVTDRLSGTLYGGSA